MRRESYGTVSLKKDGDSVKGRVITQELDQMFVGRRFWNFYYFDPGVLEGKGKTKSRTVQNKALKAILKPETPKWVDNRKKSEAEEG